MPWTNIRAIQKDPALICPRVELMRPNRAAGELALAGIRFGTEHPLWSKLFDVRTARMSSRKRWRLLYSVMAGLADETVAARIRAAREKANPKPKAPRRRRR